MNNLRPGASGFMSLLAETPVLVVDVRLTSRPWTASKAALAISRLRLVIALIELETSGVGTSCFTPGGALAPKIASRHRAIIVLTAVSDHSLAVVRCR